MTTTPPSRFLSLVGQSLAALEDKAANLSDADLSAAFAEAGEIWLSDDDTLHVARRITGTEIRRRATTYPSAKLAA